jgi:hypothetical protein
VKSKRHLFIAYIILVIFMLLASAAPVAAGMAWAG